MEHDPATMYDADREESRQPVPRKPRPPRCKQPGCRRDLEGDRYGDWVHADTLFYQCFPGDSRNRMAVPR